MKKCIFGRAIPSGLWCRKDLLSQSSSRGTKSIERHDIIASIVLAHAIHHAV